MLRTIVAIACVAVLSVGMILAQDAKQEKKSVDLSGTWDISVDTQNGVSTPTLKLKQQGENITGEYAGRMGTGQVSGTVKGDQIDFQVSRNMDGNIFVIRYVGQVVDPDKMMGEADLGDYGNATWTAKRRKP
jgi:hypothetical protein